MPKKAKNNGLILFYKCAKAVKKEFEKQGRPEKWNEIQKWTSANVYPKFKGQDPNKVTISTINNEIKVSLGIVKAVKKSPCFNVSDVNKSDFDSEVWFEIVNKIEGLPSNVQVQINANTNGFNLGQTSIQQRGLMNIEMEINPIIENIRENQDNKSGVIFVGSRKRVPNSKDNSNCSFYLLFELTADPDLSPSDDIGVPKVSGDKDVERIPRLKKAQAKATKTKREKLKDSKKKLRPTKVKPKPVKSKKKQKKTSTPLADKNKAKEILLEEFKLGLKTKEEYRKEVKKIENMFKEGGEV
jgi:hypothetical protein